MTDTQVKSIIPIRLEADDCYLTSGLPVGLSRCPLVTARLAPVVHQAQFATGGALPWKQTEAWEDLFLPESFPGQAAHRMRLAFGAKGMRI